MSRTPRIAVAFLAHHKPFLIMSNLITCLMQDYKDFDLYIIFNEGDGHNLSRDGYNEYRSLSDPERSKEIIGKTFEIERRSYQEYDDLAREHGINSKLSPFDERIHDICRLNFPRVRYLHYENDHGLDAGAWIKFMRSGIWKDYDYVFMAQEGTTLTNSGVLSAAIEMAQRHDIHMLYGAHMKGRMSKKLFLTQHSTSQIPQPIDFLHERVLRDGLELFSRDPVMRAVLDAWAEDVPSQRQFHVIDFDASFIYRLLDGLDVARPLTGPVNERRLKKLLRALPVSKDRLELLTAYVKFYLHNAFSIDVAVPRSLDAERIVCDYHPYPIKDVVDVQRQGNSFFHKEPCADWFVCGSNHMFSRHLFERLDDKFRQFDLYQIIDMPFSCTVLEVIFAYLPAWLGVDKWFFDGYHRVTKDKVTKRREDTVEGMARYVNRYYAGEIVTAPVGDLLKIRKLAPQHQGLRDILSNQFF